MLLSLIILRIFCDKKSLLYTIWLCWLLFYKVKTLFFETPIYSISVNEKPYILSLKYMYTCSLFMYMYLSLLLFTKRSNFLTLLHGSMKKLKNSYLIFLLMFLIKLLLNFNNSFSYSFLRSVLSNVQITLSLICLSKTLILCLPKKFSAFFLPITNVGIKLSMLPKLSVTSTKSNVLIFLFLVVI